VNYLDVFRKLKETRSRTRKIDILRQADSVTKSILVATYDPFTHYFINKVPAYKPVEGRTYAITSITTTILLKALASRTISGNKARFEVSFAMSSMYKEDAEIFACILRKDLRCGIGVTTINAAIPGLISDFGCMLARKYDESRYQNDLWMSLKLDGLRARFENGNFFTRNGHKIQGMEHLIKLIPKDWMFDAELKDPNIHFQKTSGNIRSFDAAPETEMFVIDIPRDAPFHTRYSAYQEGVRQINHPQIHAVKHVPVKSHQHILDTFEKSLNAGYEGLVIKPKNHIYVPKRSWDWMKLKNEKTEDVPIVDFFEGTGKYCDMLGGVIIERKNGVHVRVGSGFSDDQRFAIWNDKENYRLAVIEMKYHEETPSGSVRHPVFSQFRGDLM
jgi:DNA ligase-1